MHESEPTAAVSDSAEVAERPPLGARRVCGIPVTLLVEVPAAALLLYGFLDKLTVTRRNVLWDKTMLSALRLEIVFAVALLALLALAFPRRRLAAWAVGYAVVSLLLLASSTYAGYAGGILIARDVLLAGQVPAVWSSVEALLGAFIRRYTWDLIPVLMIGLVGSHFLAQGRVVRRHWSLWVVAGASTALCAVFLARAFLLPIGVDDIAAARERGLVAWQIAASFRAESALDSEDIPDDPQEVQALIDELTDRGFGERIADFEPGVAADRSVIVVQLEAVQSFAVGLDIGGGSLTPNLDRLAETSWYFPNTYSQVRKGTTADAEFIANTSLYPPHAGAAPIAYADQKLTSLPRLLQGEGYSTAAFHTNKGSFWNRTEMMPALGFEEFYDRAYFGDEDVIGMGPSDEVLYDKAMHVLLDLDATGAPFYAYLISITSHHPFVSATNEKEMVELPPAWEGTYAGRYLQNVEYADRALGQFLAEYEASGLAERCTLVVMGDHFGLSPQESGTPGGALLAEELGRSYDTVDAMRVPLMIRLPGQTEGHLVSETVGQVDVMPTLADALGLDIATTPHFGTSAFVRHTTLMQGCGRIAPGSYLTESVAVLPGLESGSGTVVDLSTHDELDAGVAPEGSLERIRRLSAISHAYVRSLPSRADEQPGE